MTTPEAQLPPPFIAWLKGWVPPAIYDTFDQLDAVMNLIGVIGVIITSAGFVAVLFRRRLKNAAAEIKRLNRHIALLNQDSQRQAQETAALKEKLKALEEANIDSVLANVRREWAEGNRGKAQQLIRAWLEAEGPAIAVLLDARAKWALRFAQGDDRTAGLAAARAYAISAASLDPWGRTARSGLVANIDSLIGKEGRQSLPLASALQTLALIDEPVGDKIEQVPRALALLSEAGRLDTFGMYGIALATVEEAHEMLQAGLGSDATQTLSAGFLRIRLLTSLGFTTEALERTRAAIDLLERKESHAARESWLPQYRHQLGALLSNLGQYSTALPIVIDVAEKLTSHPEFGPRHWATLSNQHLYASILQMLGRHQKSLDVLDDMREALEGTPTLRCDFQATNYYLKAMALTFLERPREALDSLDLAVRALDSEKLFGPAHLLRVSMDCARGVLCAALGDKEKVATEIVSARVSSLSANPDFGPLSPLTLNARAALATVYLETGRFADSEREVGAVLQLRDTQEAEKNANKRPEFIHRRVHCDAIHRLGQYAKALSMLETLIADLHAHTEYGTTHYLTLRSRCLLANVLLKLDRHAEGYAEISAVRTSQAEQGLSTLESCETEVNLLRRMGNMPAAQDMILQVVERLTEQFGVNAPRTISARGIEKELFNC